VLIGRLDVTNAHQLSVQHTAVSLIIPVHLRSDKHRRANSAAAATTSAIQSIVAKVYSYFHIYTVRVEALKDFVSSFKLSTAVTWIQQNSYILQSIAIIMIL